ncbi:hypothetical protein HDU76_010679, partial [Blyttiomyces sp. JEL0837]
MDGGIHSNNNSQFVTGHGQLSASVDTGLTKQQSRQIDLLNSIIAPPSITSSAARTATMSPTPPATSFPSPPSPTRGHLNLNQLAGLKNTFLNNTTPNLNTAETIPYQQQQQFWQTQNQFNSTAPHSRSSVSASPSTASNIDIPSSLLEWANDLNISHLSPNTSINMNVNVTPAPSTPLIQSGATASPIIFDNDDLDAILDSANEINDPSLEYHNEYDSMRYLSFLLGGITPERVEVELNREGGQATDFSFLK